MSKLRKSKSKKKSNKEEEISMVTIGIPKSLHMAIKDYTKERGQTIKGFLTVLVKQEFKKNDFEY